jgi:hypothetical protein
MQGERHMVSLEARLYDGERHQCVLAEVAV